MHMIVNKLSFTRLLPRSHRKLSKQLQQRTFFSKKKETCTILDNHACTISDCLIDPSIPEPSVVIIGAGIAGLSAAQRLWQCGVNNIKILEAGDRPGGRIHSCWLGDTIAEMGCQNIQGACCNNPIFTLAAQEGLLKTPGQSETQKGIFYFTSDGRAIDTATSLMASHVFNGIKNEAYSLFDTSYENEHGSLENFLYLRIHQELQKFPEHLRYDVSRILFGLTNRIRYAIGDDLNNVSADNVGSVVHIPGGDLKIPVGFVEVLRPLLRDIPENCLKFDKPVELINWKVNNKNKESRAVIRCCDGEEFSADYVIITVSLGVLKEQADQMFNPTLPDSKIKAIKSLGYGSVDKIFLHYERPFWMVSNGNIRLAWSQDELANRTDWTRGISSIEEIEGSENVLCTYISGPEAVVMEHATDKEVAEGITRVLRQFTGDASLPYPSTILRSKWTSDPYFRGAYSYMNLNSTIGHQCDLSSPVPGNCDSVPPILLFAGEATCAGHQSTAHGARLSGIREAERVIQLTKQFGGPPPLQN